MNRLACLIIASLATTPLQAETFPEMGMDPGYYTYQGACSNTFNANGDIGPTSFLFDGQNLISANSRCAIRSMDFISAGFLNAQTTCIDSETNAQTNESYTLLPDQDGRPRVKLYATYVDGELTSEGNPDWFHLCIPVEPSS